MIKNAMVIGAGVMGAQIAGHLANCGLDVLLIDILPFDENEKDRSAYANAGKKGLAKLRPAPLMDPKDANRIQTGNIEDDLKRVDEFDWILEVVIEKLEIKQDLFKKIDEYRKTDSIVTSNTSGISIAEISDGLSENFQEHFLGTHFFNPPRYLHLMELIPGPKTKENILSYMEDFMSRQIGKGVVICKDTPNFIGNRVGVHALMLPFAAMQEFKLNISEVDFLTGPLLGRPKSASFRTADVVGLDTMIHVLNTLNTKLTDDPEKETFVVPDVLQKLVENKALGNKTGVGFYKKTKEKGKTVILTLDMNDGEYKAMPKPEFAEIGDFVKLPNLGERLKKLVDAGGNASDFIWRVLSKTFYYAALTCKEIAHDIQSVDEAIKFGFGWEMGPFEMWDVLGLHETAKRMRKDGIEIPEWVDSHIEKKHTSFYNYSSDGRKGMADPFKGGWMAYRQNGIHLETSKKMRPIISHNDSTTLVDIGDGILCLEFHSPMNSAGKEVIQSIIDACKTAEDHHKGLVIGNHGQHFCVGANLKELVGEAIDGNMDLVSSMIKKFQDASMSIKYCGVPVIVAGHGMALGGGCEFIIHSPHPVLAAESYIGLVEIGVGLLPAGGGTKEMAIYCSDAYQKTGVWNASLTHALETLGMAKVSGSAHEANLLYLNGRAEIVMNKELLIEDAKKVALHLNNVGYMPGSPRKDILVSGADGYANLDLALYLYEESKMISKYDGLIAREIAKILTGGGITNPTLVTEEYLLELELDSFVKLLENEKTIARIEHMLKKGKPLRN
ncbi:MAG: 3-hydroxyacyl-CoA dehydrogenase [Planctomycetota bacterium]|nr:MAG: 3-hydroxyacyl-CoA dehydrogenase [Planctomycetota bacterium]